MEVNQVRQPWCETGGIVAGPFKDGFWMHLDSADLDAPLYVPSGSTVANANELANTRYVIGGIAHRG